MHIETKYNLEQIVRTHNVFGAINLPEFEVHLQAIYTSPEFSPLMDSLWDLRQADFSNISVNDVRSLMAIVKSNWLQNRERRVAILVGGMAEFGIAQVYARQFESATSLKIMIFLDQKMAWNWFTKIDRLQSD